ncbi:MAG: hypothetical protein ACE5J9_09365 [Methanosarcinales archaeon]
MDISALTTEQLMYILLMNVMGLTGVILLWGSLVFLGTIAKRYEQVFGEKTEWQLLLIAPAGLLIYVALISYGLTSITTGTPTNLQTDLIGIVIGSLSAVVCAYGAFTFKDVVDKIMGGGM